MASQQSFNFAGAPIIRDQNGAYSTTRPCTLDELLAHCAGELEHKLRRGEAITNPADTCRYLVARLGTREHEVFACMFLDTRHRVIAFEELFHGTIDASAVYPREIVKRALAHNAAAVIVAHNDPSGVAEPSESDRRITDRLKDALALVDVRLLDHVVVGGAHTMSFAERGLL